ncbi:hypothetical protein BH11PLA1_BH11PLA1_00150 [soil metagenome]
MSTEEKTLFGWNVDAADPALLAEALEKAFDYRGDVTLIRRDGTSVTGYIFDRAPSDGVKPASLRLMTALSDDKVRVAYADIARIEFSGKDAAHGRSFETWIKKYVEKKLKGEKANIEAEVL